MQPSGHVLERPLMPEVYELGLILHGNPRSPDGCVSVEVPVAHVTTMQFQARKLLLARLVKERGYVDVQQYYEPLFVDQRGLENTNIPNGMLVGNAITCLTKGKCSIKFTDAERKHIVGEHALYTRYVSQQLQIRQQTKRPYVNLQQDNANIQLLARMIAAFG